MVMPREGGYASGLDQLALDPVVERWLAARLSAARRSELEHLNRTISADALEVARHVDRDAPPRLVAHDLDGNRIDRAQLAPTHVALLERLRPMVALATTEPDGLLAALAAGYLLADPGLYCTITLTTQVSLALADLAPTTAPPHACARGHGSARRGSPRPTPARTLGRSVPVRPRRPTASGGSARPRSSSPRTPDSPTLRSSRPTSVRFAGSVRSGSSSCVASSPMARSPSPFAG